MDLTQVGTGLSVVGMGFTLAVVLPMSAKTKRIVGGIGIGMMIFGLGILSYGFMSSSGLQDAKTPTVITQTNTNSPGGVNALGDVTVNNPEVNPNASVVTYDFNGMRRSVSMAGALAINLEEKTPQVEAFKVMAKLEKDHDWPALKIVCEEETRKTPEWLTPPLLCGRVHVERGEIEKAIERIEYV